MDIGLIRQQILLQPMQMKFYKPANTPTHVLNNTMGFHSARQSYKNVNKSYNLDKSAVDTTVDQTFERTSHIRHKSGNLERKVKQLNYNQIKRIILTKIVINRSLNIRQALKKFHEIPSTLFVKSAKFDLVKPIIMKSKLTLQTSLLRTLIYSYGQQEKQEVKLKISTSNNTFVIGSYNKQSTEKKEAILLLSEMLKQHIRNCVQQFRKNKNQKKTIKSYISKMLSNWNHNLLAAIRSVNSLPQRSNGVEKATFLLTRMVSILERDQDKQTRLKLEALNNIKMESLTVKLSRMGAAKLLISFSRIRREQAFLIWQDSSYDCRQNNEVKTVKAEMSEEKKQALRRIIARNYFKLFRQILRRFENYKRVAVRIACRSKINEQKALWRLRMNLQRQNYHH